MDFLKLSMRKRCAFSSEIFQRFTVTSYPVSIKNRLYSTQKFVKITDVSPRDGLQNESKMIPLKMKLELIERLASTGIRSIECGSFVSPKWVPQVNKKEKLLNLLDTLPLRSAHSLLLSMYIYIYIYIYIVIKKK